MAGSRKWFRYTTSFDGTTFAISLDESNTELAGAGLDFVAPAGLPYALPVNIEPRKARYVSADTNVVRNCVLCDPAATPADSFTDPVSGQLLTLAAIIAEKIILPFAIDTGLIDGDAT